MTFYSGVKKIHEIINEIADGLIAADSTNWSDGDSLVKSVGEFSGSWVQEYFIPNVYATNSLPYYPIGVYHSRCVEIGNVIYSTGGSTSGGWTSVCYKIDLNDSNPTWVQIASMNEARGVHAIGVINGKIYVAGGRDETNFLGSIEEYDPTTNTWTTKTATVTPVEMPPHCVHNDELYLISGKNSGNVVEKYDPSTDTVTFVTSAPSSFGGGGAVSDGTNIYVSSGYDSPTKNLFYLFDPINKTFTQKTNLPWNCDISSGQMYLVSDPEGGNLIWFIYSEYGSNDLKRSVYRISTNTWLAAGGTGNDEIGRRAGTVQVGNDVYVVGGTKNGYSNENKKIYSANIYRIDAFGSDNLKIKNDSVYRALKPLAKISEAQGLTYTTDLMQVYNSNYIYQGSSAVWINFAGVDPNNSIVWTTNRRVLHHSDGIYITLEAPNWEDGYSNERMQGIRLVFTSTWDNLNHDYPSAEGYSTYVQFNGRDTNTTSAIYAISTNLSYWLWVDANGFVLMATPESTASDRQGAFCLVCERNPNKEFLDGQSNFFSYSRCNYYEYNESHFGTTDIRAHRRFVRPFVVHSSGEDGIEFKMEGLKSLGNGKVYYIKPIIFNDTGEMIPIFQSESFFKILDTGSNLVDGDIILIEGQTTQYLVKMISSPDSGTTIRYAMKYVA